MTDSTLSPRQGATPAPHPADRGRLPAGLAAGAGHGSLHHHIDGGAAGRPAAADGAGPERVRGRHRPDRHDLRARVAGGGDSVGRRHPGGAEASAAAGGHRRLRAVQHGDGAVIRLCADPGRAFPGRREWWPAVVAGGRLRRAHGAGAPARPRDRGGDGRIAVGAVTGRTGGHLAGRVPGLAHRLRHHERAGAGAGGLGAPAGAGLRGGGERPAIAAAARLPAARRARGAVRGAGVRAGAQHPLHLHRAISSLGGDGGKHGPGV